MKHLPDTIRMIVCDFLSSAVTRRISKDASSSPDFTPNGKNRKGWKKDTDKPKKTYSLLTNLPNEGLIPGVPLTRRDLL